MIAPDTTVDPIRLLEHDRERMAAQVGEQIARRDRPSPLLSAARDAFRQSISGTQMARAASGPARDEWLAVASSYEAVGASLCRLAGGAL